MKTKNHFNLLIISSLFLFITMQTLSQNITYKYNNLSGNTNIYNTLDGNFIISGYDPTVSSLQSINFFKVDSVGNVLWAKRIYHPQNFLLQIFIPLSDSTFAFTLMDGTNAIVAKLDKSGNLLWSRLVSNPVVPYSVQLGKLFEAGSGNIILGTQYNDFFKLDAQGNLIWKKKVKQPGNAGNFNINSACRRGAQMLYNGTWSDIPYTHTTSVFGVGDTAGNFSHMLRYNYPANIKVDYISQSTPLGPHKYIVSGAYRTSTTSNTNKDYIMCIDSAGIPQWKYVYPATSANIFSAGYTAVDAGLNIWNLTRDRKLLIKLDSTGTFLAGDTLNFMYPSAVFKNNKLYMLGFTPFWELLFAPLDSMHSICNSQSYSLVPTASALPVIDTLAFIVDTATFAIAPDTQTVVTNITISKNIYCVTGINEVEPNLTSIYPNPVNDILHIKVPEQESIQVELYSMQSKMAEYNSTTIDVSKLSKGIYIIKVKLDNGQQFTKKFLKM